MDTVVVLGAAGAAGDSSPVCAVDAVAMENETTEKKAAKLIRSARPGA